MSTGKLKIRRVKADPDYPPLIKLVHPSRQVRMHNRQGNLRDTPVRAKKVMQVTLDRQVEEAYRRLLS
jgi:hypothetical protein